MMFKSAVRTLLVNLLPGLLNRRIRKRAFSAALTASYPYEPEAKLIPHIVPANRPAFDVGAHYGFYSILLEGVLDPGLIFSFEPQLRPFRELRRRRMSSRVFPLALSNTAGKALLRLPLIGGRRYECRATLQHSVREPGQTGCDDVETTTSTIDRFMSEHSIDSLGFLKIDVEGHERSVIEGGLRTITLHRPVMLIEIEQRHHQRPIEELLAFIESLGYRGYFLDARQGGLFPVRQFRPEQDQKLEEHLTGRYINNFLFFPASEADEYVRRIRSVLQAEPTGET